VDIHLIWAQDSNGGIGKQGKLPWHISEDLKNFKRLTLDSTIIMGRKTWDSLPIKPLPQRNNIVFSSSKQRHAITVHSYEACISYLKNNDIQKVFIIGGRSIYKLFFNDADYLHITNIDLLNSEIDEFFPVSNDEIVNNFNKISDEKLSSNAFYSYWVKKGNI
tara:strand:- start:1026 stop:1514 length:489 start_codon:yes stop_codon:yes gene_type:complete